MSLNDNKNIEELFRSGLEDFELPVNDAMWSGISSKIGQGAAGGGVASGSSKLLTYLGLSGAACVVGVVATLVYFNVTDESSTTDNTTINNTSEIDQTITEVETPTEITKEINSEVAPDVHDDRKIVNEITQSKIDDDPVIAHQEANKGSKKVVVVKDEKPSNTYGDSWIEQMLTPKSKPYTEPNTNVVVADDTKTVAPVVEEVSEENIVASIVAAPVGGYAPLEVSFSHFSEKGKVKWEFGDGAVSSENQPTHVFDKYGKYTVTLTIEDENGNVYQDYRVIEVLANSAITKIPNVFTPNSDGSNDVYKVEGKNIEEFTMAILNTKGEILFQANDINTAWDGKDRFGDDLPVGTYVVVISARGIDGKKYENSGTVTLTR